MAQVLLRCVMLDSFLDEGSWLLPVPEGMCPFINWIDHLLSLKRSCAGTKKIQMVHASFWRFSNVIAAAYYETLCKVELQPERLSSFECREVGKNSLDKCSCL